MNDINHNAMTFIHYLTKLSRQVFSINVHHKLCDVRHVVDVKVKEVVVHEVAKAIIWCF